MKLPNGYGSVHKLSGSRRNPWRARKTAGIDENRKQRYITIGYYKTRQEALQALAAYNENPYDLAANALTFSEVYDKWSTEHFEEISPSSRKGWRAAYKYCTPIYNMKMRDLRVAHLEDTIKNADTGDTTKARIKSMLNLMYRYAMKHEIVDKDYAQMCDSIKKPKPNIVRIPFSHEEIELLKQNVSIPFVDMILIAIYSGWRPQELSILKREDVDIENMTMRGGMKTDAGENRLVPIHPAIKDLIVQRYNSDSEYLFGECCTYDRYRGRFRKAMGALKMDHKPHDTRHTFITLAKQVHMDEYILKLIVGHAIADVTEKVYTHRTMEQLQCEIAKIK